MMKMMGTRMQEILINCWREINRGSVRQFPDIIVMIMKAEGPMNM
jgi:hypothetical protein